MLLYVCVNRVLLFFYSNPYDKNEQSNNTANTSGIKIYSKVVCFENNLMLL